MGNSLSRLKANSGQRILMSDYADTSRNGEYAQEPDRAKARIYTTLIVMGLLFFILNLVQIALIYTINDIYWIALFPALVFVGFIAVLVYQCIIYGVLERWRRSKWASRLPKVGIAATIILTILAVEFGYLNVMAVPSARHKVWHTSIVAHESLPPPAMALTQGTFFQNRAVLASDTGLINQLWQEKLNATPSNQRSFTDYSTIPAPEVPGVDDAAEIHAVFFNGSYPPFRAVDDLNLAYLVYYRAASEEASLGFLAFDPKFIIDLDRFRLAIKCGIINGDLFSAYSQSQLSLEQIVINDKARAIDYSELDPSCEIPEFHHYITYRPLLIPYGPPVGPPSGCAINGTTVPEDQVAQQPCQGSIDVQFASMLVTTQTSQRSKDRVQMLTDEGGIIGGIMFVTWFLSILNQ